MSRTAEAFTDATDALAGLRTQRQEMALAHAQEVAALKTTIRELRQTRDALTERDQEIEILRGELASARQALGWMKE